MASSPDGRCYSVLVVDDNRDAADTLVVFLRLGGHNARAAYSGEQALAILQDWRPDAAVVDVVMAGIGGIELAARVRQGAARPPLLVALTGVGTNEQVALVKAGAFDHVLLKPADPDELLGLLDATRERHLHQQAPPAVNEPTVHDLPAAE